MTLNMDTDKYETTLNPKKVQEMMAAYGRDLNKEIDVLREKLKRLREDNKKLHDAIKGCAYANMQGSAAELYAESVIEECPICFQNIGDTGAWCGCEESFSDIYESTLAEALRLRERLEVIEDFINDELRAFVNSNTFDHIYDAIEKKLEAIGHLPDKE